MQDLALTPGRVDFSEFLAYYTAVSHTIGDPIVDFVSTDEDNGAEDDIHLLMNLVLSSSSRSNYGSISPQSTQTDAFEKLICLAWRV
ncbi:unnamed protein product [Dibothriocephalus latus]|uniref:Uncharacterized protein n=1 Tax=Dibothriocephalus latus TaxID=60516 RepID=A0A3P7RNS3_DIBLA|nr:unnamed protein product [Dibothriocephalus latus]